MLAFTTLTGIAAPLKLANIDTDMIIPKQYLRTIKRTGLGIHLFDEMRHDDQGNDNPDFILNQPPYNKATILLAGENFGCGSSREHAPWALLDFGLRCVIAPSFADIFYNNCFKNGILPLVLPADDIAVLGQTVSVDLGAQQVRSGNHVFDFSIDPFRKTCLLEGLDDIGLTLANQKDITVFEGNQPSYLTSGRKS